MTDFRIERDAIGEVKIGTQSLWGPQTERSLTLFDIGEERFPPSFIKAYAYIKKACARVNQRFALLSEQQATLIIRVCDELLEGEHLLAFPVSVWISGSGTQFNMNVNEVIVNRICELQGHPLGSKQIIHPNDHVNQSQSTNDSFPTAMCISTAMEATNKLLPALKNLQTALAQKALAWQDIIKIGRTHLQDAIPLSLGQEFSGYAHMLLEAIQRVEQALQSLFELPLGGTAIGTGLNAPQGFGEAAVTELAQLTGLPFVSAPNKFAAQGSHDGLVQFSATLKTAAVALFKIANDIRLLASGPRCGLGEMRLPENEPGSSIMPGKVNPTQCEALTMVAIQVMAADFAVTLGGAGGILEMNVYKPLIIFNILKSIRLLSDAVARFQTFLIEGIEPNLKQIDHLLQRSLMLVTALSPMIGYDKASQVAHFALAHDLSLKEATLTLGFLTAEAFDQWVDPKKMV